MAQGLSGPGVGLPLPQNLYPSYLQNAPLDTPTNKISLAAGDALIVPAGDWLVDAGSYCVVQFLDPVSNTWRAMPSSAWNGGFQFIKSDGFTIRVANLTGCVFNIVPTAYGSAYVQASTTATVVGPANVTAAPIVGGQLTLVGGTLTSVGAGYGMAPLVFIPAPPPPSNNANGIGGIQATAYTGITSGTVSFISFTNPGAGYPSAPIPVIVPNPADPNINVGITSAVAAFSLVGSGSITGCLVTNNGSPLPDNSLANVSVVLAGAGSSGSLVANVLQTVKVATVVGTGLGYGTGNALIGSAGGSGSAGTVTNGPEVLGLNFRPRPANITLAVVGSGSVAAQVGSIVDGGLFLSAPVPVVSINPAATGISISGATVSFVMGSRPDIITLQPAP
jgi:hypothetical protein